MDNIILYNEDNNEVKFNIIDTFGVDDKNYCALQKDNDDMILILEVINNDKEVLFKSIDDQKELDEIIELYEQMRDESNGK